MRQLKDFSKHYASHAAKVMMPKCLILFCACLVVGNKPSAAAATAKRNSILFVQSGFFKGFEMSSFIVLLEEVYKNVFLATQFLTLTGKRICSPVHFGTKIQMYLNKG